MEGEGGIFETGGNIGVIDKPSMAPPEENKEQETGGLIRELLSSHQKQLEATPSQGMDFFTLPEPEDGIKEKYDSLTPDQVKGLTKAWVNGEIDQELEEEFGPRAVGSFLRSLVDSKTEEVLEAVKEDFPKSIKSEQDERKYINTSTLLTSSTKKYAAYDIPDTEADERTQDRMIKTGKYENLKRGITEVIAEDKKYVDLKYFMETECPSTFFFGVKDKNYLPALKAIIQSSNLDGLTDENLMNLKFSAVVGVLSIQINNGEEIDQETMDLAIGSEDSAQITQLLFAYFSADKDKDPTPDTIKNKINLSSLDLSNASFIISTLLSENKTINPNSFLAEKLQSADLDVYAILDIVKVAAESVDSDWEKVDPFIKSLVESKINSNERFSESALSNVLSPFMAYGKDLPPFLAEYLKNYREVFSQLDFRFDREKEADIYGYKEKYPLDPREEFFTKGFSAFPESVRDVARQEIAGKEFNKAEYVLKSLFIPKSSRYSWDAHNFYQEFVSKYCYERNYYQEFSGNYWKLVHGDIWEVVSKMDPEIVFQFFESEYKENDQTLELDYKDEDEGISQKNIPLAEFIPPQIAKDLVKKISPDGKLSADALNKLNAVKFLITDETIQLFDPNAQNLLKIFKGLDKDGKDVIIDISKYFENMGENFVEKDGKLLMKSKTLLEVLNSMRENIKNENKQKGYFSRNPVVEFQVRLNYLLKVGLIDLSDRQTFTEKEDQFYSLLLNPILADVFEDYMTEEDGEKAPRMERFFQEFDIKPLENGDALKWEYAFKDELALQMYFKLLDKDDPYALIGYKLTPSQEAEREKKSKEYNKNVSRLSFLNSKHLINHDRLVESVVASDRYEREKTELLKEMALSRDIDSSIVPQVIAKKLGLNPEEIEKVKALFSSDMLQDNYGRRITAVNFLFDIYKNSKSPKDEGNSSKLFSLVIAKTPNVLYESDLRFITDKAEAYSKLKNFSYKTLAYETIKELDTANVRSTIDKLLSFEKAAGDFEREDLALMVCNKLKMSPANSKNIASALNSEYFQELNDRINGLKFLLDIVNGKIPEDQIHNLPMIVNRLSPFIAKDGLHSFVYEKFESLVTMSDEQLKSYMQIYQDIYQSPSEEVRKIKDQLLNQIFHTEDPVNAYKQIEMVFVKNNLPLVGKVFKVFEILYPPETYGRSKSPVIQATGTESQRRKAIFYRDLLKVHLLSDNPSLDRYMKTLSQGASILDKATTEDALSAQEQNQLKFFLRKMDALYEITHRGREPIGFQNDNETALPALLQKAQGLKKSFGVREGQTALDRVSELFLRPVGLTNIQEALERMRNVKKQASERNLEEVQNSDGSIKLSAGDLLKGVPPQFFSNTIQNGIVCKEFVGEQSDATPLDIDLSIVLEDDVKDGFESALNLSLARTYGSVILGIKDRGQFEITRDLSGKVLKTEFDKDKFELFLTGEGRHFGIRTGIPSTEIDFIIAQNELTPDSRELDKIYFSIAESGFYIPVVDKTGKIIFTPEMYKEYRHTFDGIERFDGEPLEIERTKPEDKHYEKIQEIIAQSKEDQEKVKELSSKVRAIVEETLKEEGIILKEEFDTGIIGAELHNIGSSGRYTNKPGDYDFDLTLLLDAYDSPKLNQIYEKIKSKLHPKEDKSHSEMDRNYIQLRAIGTETITPGSPLDIDIGMTKKSDLQEYGTHQALEDKLNWIKLNLGEDAYFEVIANIILAKKVLSEGSAYKKLEHGGLGGVGVEHWILANKGNMLTAFRSFWDAAHDEQGKVLPIGEFEERYKILDAGINMKFLRHDNCVNNIKPEGYQAMLKVIGEYLELS